MLLPSFPARTNDMFPQSETIGSRSVRNAPDPGGRVLSVVGQLARSDSEDGLARPRRPADPRDALADSRERSGQS
jgi:hypothetical protein